MSKPFPYQKILLLGATGMLGQEIHKQLSQYIDLDLLSPSSQELDISNTTKFESYLEDNKPDCIINTVALVNLNECEANPKKAYSINAKPIKIIFEFSKKMEFKFIHISTDHYFNSQNLKHKHSENETVVLLNEYAKTKFQAEEISNKITNSLILRTNVIGFRNKIDQPTFIEWAIEAIKNQKEIVLFNDFFTSPISTRLFTKYMIELIKLNAHGLYNLASSQVSHKKEFIQTLAKMLNSELTYTEKSIHSLNGPKRARSLGLNVAKCEQLLKCKMPNMEEVLEDILK